MTNIDLKDIKKLEREYEELSGQVAELRAQFFEYPKMIDLKKKEVEYWDGIIANKNKDILEIDNTTEEKKKLAFYNEFDTKERCSAIEMAHTTRLKEIEAKINSKNEEYANLEEEMRTKSDALFLREKNIANAESVLNDKSTNLERQLKEIREKESNILSMEDKVKENQRNVYKREKDIQSASLEIDSKNKLLESREKECKDREDAIEIEKQKLIEEKEGQETKKQEIKKQEEEMMKVINEKRAQVYTQEESLKEREKKLSDAKEIVVKLALNQ